VTNFEAPTQVAILRQLSQLRDAENARQDHIIVNGDRAVAATWINDGLELEDSQYVANLYLCALGS
jgi:hypothetical protein